jgi:hypothetical protein
MRRVRTVYQTPANVVGLPSRLHRVSASGTPGTSFGAMYAEYQVPESVPDVPSGPDVPVIPADPTPPGGDPEPMDIAA